jgi:hypothetical protein
LKSGVKLGDLNMLEISTKVSNTSNRVLRLFNKKGAT